MAIDVPAEKKGVEQAMLGFDLEPKPTGRILLCIVGQLHFERRSG